MVREQRANVTQVHVDIRVEIVPRKDQTAKARKGRMRDDIADCAVNAQMAELNLHSRLVRVAGGISDKRRRTVLICTRIKSAHEQS